MEQATYGACEDQLIVFDLEATCWESEPSERQEILEIGAVRMDASGSALAVPEHCAVFSELVRPTIRATLSAFCIGLTAIQQDEADAADAFPAVFRRFIDWIGVSRFWLCSWGTFDRAQLQEECLRYGLVMPPQFAGHINMRREFARWKKVRPPGLQAAMELSGLEKEGSSHRALADARNLARLTGMVLRERGTNERRQKGRQDSRFSGKAPIQDGSSRTNSDDSGDKDAH